MAEAVKEGQRFIGKCVWFSKGYGFVCPSDPTVNKGADLFCHFTNLEMDGFRTLKPEQMVSFELGTNERGPQCIKVRVIKDAPEPEETATDELDTF